MHTLYYYNDLLMISGLAWKMVSGLAWKMAYD